MIRRRVAIALIGVFTGLFLLGANAQAQAPVISNVLTTASETTATLTWSTDQPAASAIAYGLTTQYELGQIGEATTSPIIVDFEDVGAPINDDMRAAFIPSAGMNFVEVEGTTKFGNGERTTHLDTPYNYNGGTYFYAYGYYNAGWVRPSLRMSAAAGFSFTLQSLDLGEVALFAAAEWIEIRAIQSDGNELLAIVPLDGLLDGPGGVDDFQSVSFDSSWTDLVSVSFTSIAGTKYSMFALDNIQIAEELDSSTGHSVTLEGLMPGTNYFAEITAQNATGEIAEPVTVSITTAETGSLSPPILGNISASAGETSATIIWTTDEPATSLVEYGESVVYELGTVDSTSLITTHSLLLVGLTPGTTHHYRVTSIDVHGNPTTSADMVFATPAQGSSSFPTITSLTATPGELTAILDWTTDEPTTSTISIGLTNQLELATFAEGTTTNVSIDFEDIVVPVNDRINAADFTSSGYSFDVSNDESNFLNGELITFDGFPYSYSGDNYFYLHGFYSSGWVKPSVTMASSSGAVFTLQSLDIAEVALSIPADTVEIRGLKKDGSEVSVIVTLDGVNDGVGGNPDFEQIVFDGSWTGLTSVTFQALTGFKYAMFAIDNIVLVEEIEYFTNHSLPMIGLLPDTQYFVEVVSFDVDGNPSAPVSLSFITLDGVALNPPAINNLVVTPTENGAFFDFSTDEAAIASVAFGLTDQVELGVVSTTDSDLVTIDFEEIPVPVDTDIEDFDFTSQGYLFDLSHDESHFVNGEVFFGSTPYSHNGSQYFYLAGFFSGGWVYPTLTITATAAAEFSLQSLDIAEVVPSISAGFVEIRGTLADGSQITQNVLLDGVSDGAGGLADFQTVSFDSTWTGLTNVSVVALTGSQSAVIGLDNIVLVEAPEFSFVHSLFIDGLSPDTLHFARVLARDPEANVSVPIDLTFSTFESGALLPPVISNLSVSPQEGTAVVTWTTDEPSAGGLDFGETTAYELGSIAESSATTRVIDFEDIVVPLNDDIDAGDFNSGGYFFDISNDHSNFANGELFFLGEPVSYNGTTYFFVHGFFDNGFIFPTTTMSAVNGSPFTLSQLDISDATLLANAYTVEITGTRPDGSTVSIIHSLDGILDGTGPANDFETLVFDSAWSNLSSVTFQALDGLREAEFVLDNIVVVEPANFTTAHSITISALNPDTNYEVRVFASDTEGNSSLPATTQFTTLSVGTLAPPVVSGVAFTAQLDSLTVTWTTDKESTGEIQYGLTDQYELGSVFASGQTSTASIVDFEDISVPVDTEIDSLDFSSGGFFFDISNDLSNFANGEVFAGTTPFSYNDSAYFFLHGSFVSGWIQPTVTISPASADNFTLESFDIAEVTLPTSATTIEVFGIRDDGSTITTTVVLDGVNDGLTGSVDFQTVTFDANWSHLISVSLTALTGTDSSTFALDDLVVTTFSTGHSVDLPGLLPDQNYFIRILVYDVYGNASLPTELMIDTIDPFPPVIGNIALLVESITTMIDWTTDEVATSVVEYGLTAGYELGSISSSALVSSHSLLLPGLAPDTLYHFRVISVDPTGNSQTTPDMTFVTSNDIDSVPPILSALAIELADTSATLTWTTNERATSEVAHGPTDQYELGTISNAGTGGLATIDFEDIVVPLDNDIDAGDFSSGGFNFDISDDHSNFANGELFFLGEPVSYNGTTYFFVHGTFSGGWIYPTTIMTSESGSLFSLVQLDISDATLLANAFMVEITGTFSDGSTISTIHTLDGILDGSGPANDFETLVFDSSWSDLVSVQFQALDGLKEAEFVLDDIIVDESGNTVSHRIQLPDLTPDTTYHYEVASEDDSGNRSATPDLVFTTLGLGEVPGVPPTLYGGGSTTPFGSIDPATGLHSAIATSNFVIMGMAYDPDSNTIYAAGQEESAPFEFKLVHYSPSTGYLTTIGSTNQASTNIPIDGLAFDSLAGTLYGVEIDGAGSAHLYSIDAATGALTSIGVETSLVLEERFGLAYAANADVLYGLGTPLGGSPQLVTINRATGAHSFVGDLGPGVGTAGALGFHATSATLYSVDNSSDEFLSVTPSTGAATPVGPTSASEIDGLTSLSTSATDPSLFAGYDFEAASGSTVPDISGNGHTGTLENGASFASDATFGTVMASSPPTGNLNLGPLDIEGGELTILLWMRADSFGISDARFFSKATGTSTNSHYYMVSTYGSGSKRLRFRLKTSQGGTTTLIASSGILTPNTWIHVAATYDGAEMRIYQDGILVGSQAKTGSLVTAPSVDTFLGDNTTGGKTFDGNLDELRIYTRALTQAEIQAEMDRFAP